MSLLQAGAHPPVKHRRYRVRLLCVLAISLAYALTCSAVSSGDVPATYNLRIESQRLGDALQEFARQTGIQIVFFSWLTEGLRAPEISGPYTTAAALEALLAGSRLTFHVINSKTVEIRPMTATRGPGRTSRPQAERTGGAALQESAEETGQLAEVVINGTAEGLVATRTETPLRDIPQTVSILSFEQIRQQNSASLDEALARATGITAVRNNSLQQTFYSRGYQITSLHIDGGAALNAMNTVSTPFLGTPDLSEFDRVEVLRGADALFGGDSNPGATINMVRKRPLDARALTVSAWSGSHRDYRVEADITGPLGLEGALRGRFDGVYASQDYFYDIASLERKRAFAVFEYDLAPGTVVTAGASYQMDDALPTTSGMPRYPDGSDPGLARHTSFGFDWASYDTRTREIYLQLKHAFSSSWRLQLSSTSLRATADFGWGSFQSSMDPVSKGLISAPSAVFSLRPNTQDQLVFDATLTGVLHWFGRRQEIAVGSDYRHFKGLSGNSGTSFGLLVSNAFEYDPALYPDPRPFTSFGFETHASSNQGGVFASMRVYLDEAWSVIGGARVGRDEFRLDAYSGLGELRLSDSNSYTTRAKVTPYLGVLYALSSQYSLYASYSDIYRTSGPLKRRDGKLVIPVDGVVEEMGIKSAWRDGLVNGSLAVYRVRQYGLPQFDSDLSPGMPIERNCCYVQNGKNVGKGVDMELNGSLAPGWLIGAGYTFNNNRNDDMIRLSDETPRHLANLWLSGQLPGVLNRFAVGSTVHAQSSNSKSGTVCANAECSAIRDFKVEQGTYMVVDARTSYQVDAHWRAALSIVNVFDRRYLQTVALPSGGNWFGEPRGFLFRLDGRF